MENKINIRMASIHDLRAITDIFNNAIKVMCSNGINQWDDIYPNEETIYNDIMNKQMFLGEMCKNIVSVFVLN